MLTKKRTYKFLAVLLALFLCVVAVFAIHHSILRQRSDDYEDALAELDAKTGQYDEKTIVLTGTNIARAKKLAREFDAELRISNNGRFATLALPDGVTVRDVYSDRDNMKYLSEMSLNYKVRLADAAVSESTSRPDYEVTDTEYSKQTYLDYLNFGRVWHSYRGNRVKIAVIDTGIDTDHPEFEGRISELSYNATLGKSVKGSTTADGSYDWSLIEDEYGHGTMVSGVIAAGMNGEGTVGIAPEATIITIKVEADETGAMMQSDLIFGIYYAIEAGAHIVNMSFGGYALENNFADALSLAYENDMILVASAGNDSTSSIHWPSADENVIAVGALEANGWNLAGYSNYGDNTDLVAPGTVYTTVMGGGYDTVNGTSFSAPIVAGAMGLLREKHMWDDNYEIIPLLYASARDLGDLGRDFRFGYGAIDIATLIYETRYTVTYDMMTDELDDMSETVIADHTLQHAPVPERLYSVFDGWYYDPYYTTEYTFGVDVISSNITLYAKWSGEDDGVPFTYNSLSDGTLEITSYIGRRRYITVPEYVNGRVVSAIADGAFSGERDIRQIILPTGIRKIGNYAFSQCTSITEIKVPAGVSEIGMGAFSQCVRLRSLSFEDNSSLRTVGDLAFEACASLTDLIIPRSVEKINGSAFLGTSGLTAITVENDSAYFVTVDGVLFNKTKSTLVAYPSGKGGDYTLPSNTQTIGRYAFAHALAAKVSLGSVSIIEDYAFAHARITAVTLPDTLVSLGDCAFYVAESLSKVSIGSGLEKIPANAFYMTALKSVVIPEKITAIGSRAFESTPLSELKFEDGSQLRSIGSSAFSGANLTTITLPDNVTGIGAYAFAGNIRLASIVFGAESSLNAIGAYAFSQTISLTSISLPKGLEKIGDRAFNLSGITGSVTLPDGLSYFGAGAFSSCDVSEFKISDTNSSYATIDGVLFNKTYDMLVAYPAARTNVKYTVPVHVTRIGSYAFAGASHLIELELGNIIELMPYSLFEISGITALNLPYSLVKIGEGAFSGNYGLTDISFPNGSSMTVLGEYAISGCGVNYFTVPASVEKIEPSAFYNLPNLYGVTFDNNSALETLEARTFYRCDLLYTINFRPGSSLRELKPYALDGLSNLENINLEQTELEIVGDFSMRFCKNLRAINLPSTLEKIGSYAFYTCTGISEITIPSSVNYIGSYAFLGTENIYVYFVSDVLPDTLIEDWDRGIKSYSVGAAEIVTDGYYKYSVSDSGAVTILNFTGSDKVIDLTALTLPDGGYIKTIGGSAFSGIDIEEIVLPDTLVTIQNRAFYKSNLKSVKIPKSVEFIGKEAFYGTPIELLTFESEACIKRIEQSAFENTASLAALTLPNSLEELGRYAFRNSGIKALVFEDGILLNEISEETFAGTDITELKIPEGITKICDGAFRETDSLTKLEYGTGNITFGANAFYMSGLSEIYIGKNVTLIEEFALTALTNLTSFEVDPDHPYYKSVSGMIYTKDGRKIISAPAGMGGTVVLPEGTEEIGYGAFERSKIERIIFPDNTNILSVGYRAFFGAERLKSIEIPKSVVSIDYYAFAYCHSLTEVAFGNGSRLSGVYEGAFYDCRQLSEISLPDTVAEISDFAFYACGSLSKIPISDRSSLKGIYSYAFAYTSLTELKLHPTVTELGEYAFLGADLKKAEVSAEREKDLIIGIGAFEANNNLEEITLPFIGSCLDDEAHTWFSYIFGAGGYKATTTYMPASLKRVTINGSQSFLGENAFANIESLEEIVLPDTVSAVYGGAFENVSARYELTAEELTEVLSYGNGYVGIIEIPEGVESVQGYMNFKYVTEFILPESATEIGYMAFLGCESLTTVTIPNSVTIIDSYAFASCSSLTSIKLPDELVSIGYDSFWGCHSLKELTLPPKLASIEASSFSYCDSLEKITNNSDMELVFGYGVAINAKIIVDKFGMEHKRPLSADHPGIEDHILTDDGLRFDYSDSGSYTLIGYLGTSDTITLPQKILGSDYEILYVDGIQHLVIPKDFGVISSGAFCDSKTLKSVVIEGGETDIDNSAFRRCENLLSVEIGNGVKSLGQDVFSGCTSLKSVSLPDTVTSIPSDAFFGCTSLETINLPANVEYVNERSFEGCTSLVEIEIPGSVWSIGNRAFAGCISLQKATLGEGINYVNDEVFLDCVNLTSIGLPNSVYHINPSSLHGTAASIILKPDNPNFKEIDGIIYRYDSMTGEEPLTEIIYVPMNATEVTIPAGVDIGDSVFKDHIRLKRVEFADGYYGTTIYSNAFYNCTSLEGITLPDSIEVIGSNVFRGCTSLKSIKLPSGLKHIDNYAMADCSALREIQIPNSVMNVGIGAFAGCTSITEIEFPSGITEICDEVLSGCTALDSVTLPSSVTKIGSGAFSDCASLSYIALPDRLEYIDSYAFEKTGIVELDIPSGVTSIGYMTFYRCEKLKTVKLPSNLETIYSQAFRESSIETVEIPAGVNTIGDRTFYQCKDLRSIVLNDGLQKIESCSLSGCISLEIIELPPTLTSVGEKAFENCTALKEIEFPSSLTYSGWSALSGCTSLTRIYIPGSLEEIPYGFASQCSALTTLTIGEGVKTIGSCAFEWAEMLSEVTLPSTVAAIENEAFHYCSRLYTVYNNTDLDIGFNFGEFGCVGSYAYKIVKKDGAVKQKTTNDGRICEIIKTPDGFTFEKAGNDYSLIAYSGNEETVTLPLTVNGNKYSISGVYGAINIIVPSDFVPAATFASFSNNTTVKSIVIRDGTPELYLQIYGCPELESVTIGNGISSLGHFYGCPKLGEINFGDHITSIYSDAFNETAYYANEDNWEGDCLYLNGCLVAVRSECEYLSVRDDIRLIASGVFDYCYNLKYLRIGDVTNTSLSPLTNLECLELTVLPRRGINQVFGTVPETLKSVVLAKGVKMTYGPFYGIKDITVFVEEENEDLGWDENYGSWHNGNTVIYGDRWIKVHFLDENGKTLSINPQASSQVIRIPYIAPTYDDYYVYTVIGFDLDGDGERDTIPAISTVDITARAVTVRTPKEYEVKFVDKNGTTPLYVYRLPYGSQLPVPEDPTKPGYTFLGWLGYPDDNTVVGDVTIKAEWKHDGYGHAYGAPVWVAPTCTENGGYRSTCSICGEYYTTSIADKTGHSYTMTVVSPSCLTVGYDLYTCTCGESYKENYKDPTGHSFGAWIEITPPTCTILGKAERVCSVCSETEETPLAMKEHTYQKSVTQEATCHVEGEITYLCSCGDKVKESIPTQGHKLQRVYESDEQFAVYQEYLGALYYANDGSRYCLCCTDCGYLVIGTEVDLNATLTSVNSICLHDTGDWQVIDGGSCTLNEVSGRICSLCGKTVEARISSRAVGHDLGDWVAPKVPDCESDGNVGYYECTICHAYFDGDYNRLDTVVNEKLGHDYDSWHETLAPGCTTNGEETSTCTRCGATDTRPINSLGHDYVSTLTPPDCTNDGYTTHDCSRCDEWYVDCPVDALGHDYVPTVTPPTCKDNGYTTNDCSRCDEWYVDSPVDALGHDYAPTVTPPTCKDNGYTTHNCSRCDDWYTDTYVPTVDHSYGAWYTADEPDCYTEGTEKRHCTSCGATDTRPINPLGHDYVSTLTPPDCINDGYTLHSCIRCDEEYKDSFVDPLDHLFDSWYETTPPKCEEEGERRRDCKRCTHFETESVDAIKHNYTAQIIPPICAEQGYTLHTCTLCGNEYADTYVSALDHEYDDWYEFKPQECELAGEKRRDCIRCDAYDTKATDPLGHDYQIVEVVAPECDTDGWTAYKCTRCPFTTMDDYTDKLNHEYGEWYEIRRPTCEIDGERGRTCSRCTEIETETISHTNHSYSQNTVAPTCTEPGCTTYTCDKCGKVETGANTDALGHLYDGESTVCTRCGFAAENVEKLDTGAVIAIISGSVAAVGLGISLFWFVIRKKKTIHSDRE